MELVTVTLVGDLSNPWECMQLGAVKRDARPYAALAKIELSNFSHDEPLLNLLHRAAEAFSVATDDDRGFTPGWVAFCRPEVEQSLRLQPHAHTVLIPWVILFVLLIMFVLLLAFAMSVG